MRAFAALALSIVRLYLRDRLTVVLTLLLTCFMMVVFALVMGESEFQLELPLAVVDHAQNDASQEFLAKLRADSLLKIATVPGETELDEQLRQARVVAGLVIQPGFTAGPAQGQASVLSFVQSNKASLWVELALERIEWLRSGAPKGEVHGIDTVHRPIDPIRHRYIDFIFPGILAMTLMQACLASGTILLDTRATGVMRRLRLTPVNTWTIFSAFLSGRILVVILQLIVLTAVAVLGFGVIIQAHWAQFAALILLGSAAFLALGLAIASLAPTLEAGNVMVQSISFPMSFLCGVFINLDHVPAFLRVFAEFLPLTYLVRAMRGTVNAGLPLSHFSNDLLMLTAWLFGAILAGALAFRYLRKDEI